MDSLVSYKYLLEEYVKKKRSMIDIAKDCDCGRQYVYRKLREFNIPSRTQKEARKLAYDRHKIPYTIMNENGTERLVTQGSISINENFFVTWSKEMAYVLGALYTDGNLFHDVKRGTYRIILSQKEPELLNKVLKLMDCDARIRHRKQPLTSGDIHFFDIQHKKVYSDLVNFGLRPNKSKIIEFPDIPSEFVRHFIRGCWDGDGSVFFVQSHLEASYTSGSIKFIERLVQELNKVGISRPKLSHRIEKHGKRVVLPITEAMLSDYPDGKFPLVIHEEKRSNAHYMKIRGKENIKKLFHYFYDGVDESMYLSRKYNAFVKGLKLEKRETEQLTLDLDF